jgi:CcmD family protein
VLAGSASTSASARLSGAGGLQETQQPKQTDEFVPISQLPPQDQLPAAPLLVTAYAFVWVVLFAYVVSVGRRLTKVQHEVERLEVDIAKRTRT